MIRKFFPLDKNYLLEAAQLQARDRLLSTLVDKAKEAHQAIHNPLGLNDAFSQQLKAHVPDTLEPLYPFYENLAGVYRYKCGETQLGFLWDGGDHQDHYEREWSAAFETWCQALCRLPQFVQAVLDLSVFHPGTSKAPLAENRMNAVMLDWFALKIHPRKGIVRLKTA